MEVLGGERDLMEAIYTKGPMTVSVDAASPSFRFYKSGVFDNDKYAWAVYVAGSWPAQASHVCLGSGSTQSCQPVWPQFRPFRWMDARRRMGHACTGVQGLRGILAAACSLLRMHTAMGQACGHTHRAHA